MMRSNTQHAAAVIGFVVVLWPSLRWYVARLGDGADERLGLVVLAVGLAFAWIGRWRLRSGSGGRGLAVVLLLAYLLGLGTVPNLLVAALGIGAVVSYWGLWRLPGVVGLLLLSLPLVASLQFYLGYPLRLMTAIGAESLLSLGWVEIERTGVQLSTHGGKVGVEPACSGVKMLWAGGVYTMLIASALHLRWGRVLALGFVALALVLVANVLRATLLVLPEAGVVPLSGTSHELVGIGCFAAAALVIGRFAGAQRSGEITTVVKGGGL